MKEKAPVLMKALIKMWWHPCIKKIYLYILLSHACMINLAPSASEISLRGNEFEQQQQSLNREGHRGTTDDFATSFLHFSLFFTVLGLAELQACPFPDVVFPPLPLSALSSSPFHCVLQDGQGIV